ncbi:MAG TPA: hypothetical protein VEU30_10375, partial [Thermoanaerobaculia bacterium]|nr:hypothetical protein [Thermoanaerobaculia bacterium]
PTLASIATLDEIVTRSLDARRFNARVLTWRPVFAGILGGAGASVAASRILRTMIAGVAPFDPFSYAVVFGSLVVVAVAVATAGFRHAAGADIQQLLTD